MKNVTTQTLEESLTPRGGAARRTLRKRSEIEAFPNFQTEFPRPARSGLLRVEMAPISSSQGTDLTVAGEIASVIPAKVGIQLGGSVGDRI